MGNPLADGAVRSRRAARLFRERVRCPSERQGQFRRPVDPRLWQHRGEYGLLHVFLCQGRGDQDHSGALQLHLREGRRRLVDRGPSLVGRAAAAAVRSLRHQPRADLPTIGPCLAASMSAPLSRARNALRGERPRYNCCCGPQERGIGFEQFPASMTSVIGIADVSSEAGRASSRRPCTSCLAAAVTRCRKLIPSRGSVPTHGTFGLCASVGPTTKS